MNFGIENFEVDLHFSTGVYRINREDLISTVKPVFDEYIARAEARGVDKIFPAIMSELMHEDHRISALVHYVSEIAWDVLDSQGYDMSYFYTTIDAMWGQSHHKTSSMEYHDHPNTVLTCFYFIDTPDNSSTILLNDPRQSKVFANLPVKQDGNLSLAMDKVFYNPKPGDLIITNGWLPHSVTRNRSDSPYNFLHINIGVIPKDMQPANDEPIVV